MFRFCNTCIRASTNRWTRNRCLAITLLGAVALLFTSGPGLAAESQDSCSGFIDVLPAVINAEGIWCLRQNLSTNASSGVMISVETNNVTIDCNGFKIGGLGGGAATTALAIGTNNQNKLRVRHCAIQGFLVGIGITGTGYGHLVENNLLDQNRGIGLTMRGNGTIARQNTVTNAGGSSTGGDAVGIDSDGDIIDNVVDGISGGASVTTFSPTGIQSGLATFHVAIGVLIQGNRVRNLTPKGGNPAIGIRVNGTENLVRDNVVTQTSVTAGSGIRCFDGSSTARDNLVMNYGGGDVIFCKDGGGNSLTAGAGP
jgi:hypothetical protein